ncbi:aminotransferase class V-fold PLP-dependent enzyme [Guggenheimella bovis]
MIYLDQAATSFYKPQSVREAVYESFDYIANASRGVSDLALNSERLFLETRMLLGELVNANPKRVCFTMNATDSLNTILRGLLKPTEHVITSVMEHNSVLRVLYDIGLEISFLPILPDGSLDLTILPTLLKPHTKAIVLTHAANLTGVINPIKEVGVFAKEKGLLFIVDASQSAGVIPIDMEDMHISALALTGHKGLFGPQGTGALALEKGIEIGYSRVGGSGIQTFSKTHPEKLPTRLEAGTQNGHGIAGLRAGLQFIQRTGVEAIHKKEMELYHAFLEPLRKEKNLIFYGLKEPKTAVLALNLNGIDSAVLSEKLLERGIVQRSGGHCAPLHHEAFGTVEQGMVRFSFSYFNEYEDVIKASEALIDLSKELL